MKELVFATNNNHKLEEIRSMLRGRIAIKSLADIHCDDDIPETGTTFHENASQKSHYIAEHFGMNCFGDDSGLSVETLHGEPGVYSARYAGVRDMDINMALLLKNLKGKSNRKASFCTVISLLLDGKEYFFEGRISGTIIDEKRGERGFGYDPLFVPVGYDKTFAEMKAEEKNAISHRAIAVQKLARFLTAEYSL